MDYELPWIYVAFSSFRFELKVRGVTHLQVVAANKLFVFMYKMVTHSNSKDKYENGMSIEIAVFTWHLNGSDNKSISFVLLGRLCWKQLALSSYPALLTHTDPVTIR